MKDHPLSPPSGAPPEDVRVDVGAWISGPGVNACQRCGQPAPDGSDWCGACENEDAAEALAALRGSGEIPRFPVAAGDVNEGDVIIIDDGTRAAITDIRRGDFWLTTGQHGPGVAIGWQSGSSSGVMFRRVTDLLDRVAQ